MPPVTFTDETIMGAEARGGLVQLVTRDPAGVVLDGREFAPAEALQLAQDLSAAAFIAHAET